LVAVSEACSLLRVRLLSLLLFLALYRRSKVSSLTIITSTVTAHFYYGGLTENYGCEFGFNLDGVNVHDQLPLRCMIQFEFDLPLTLVVAV